MDSDTTEKEFLEGTWRLDKAANRTAYERQFMALFKLATAKEEKRQKLWDMLPMGGIGGDNVDAWAAKMKTMLDDKQKVSLGVDDGQGNSQDSMGPSCKESCGRQKRVSGRLDRTQPVTSEGGIS